MCPADDGQLSSQAERAMTWAPAVPRSWAEEPGRPATNMNDLRDKLDHLELVDESEPLSPQASQDLIASIRTFIRTGHADVESASA